MSDADDVWTQVTLFLRSQLARTRFGSLPRQVDEVVMPPVVVTPSDPYDVISGTEDLVAVGFSIVPQIWDSEGIDGPTVDVDLVVVNQVAVQAILTSPFHQVVVCRE